MNTEMKTCETCETEMDHWHEDEEGLPFCSACFKEEGGDCDGCHWDDCVFCNEDEEDEEVESEKERNFAAMNRKIKEAEDAKAKGDVVAKLVAEAEVLGAFKAELVRRKRENPAAFAKEFVELQRMFFGEK